MSQRYKKPYQDVKGIAVKLLHIKNEFNGKLRILFVVQLNHIELPIIYNC